jgi:hypothetical protein
VTLGFGIEVGHQPPARSLSSRSNEIGVFSRRFPKWNPPHPHPSGKDHESQETQRPDRESRPGWGTGRVEKGEEDQGKPSETGTEEGEGAKARGSEGELLYLHRVAKFDQVSGDKITSRCCLDTACFAGEPEYLASGFV